MVHKALTILLVPLFLASLAMGMKLKFPRQETLQTNTSMYPNFDEYMTRFGKSYDDEERLWRTELYLQRLDQIHSINSDGESVWTAGVNQFTDMTDAEQARYRGLKGKRIAPEGATVVSRHDLSLRETAIPIEIDWREKAPEIVSPVRDQGGCGSCWAYAVAGVIEAQIAQKTGKMVDISEEEMISCTPNPQKCGGEGGCSGATEELALKYVKTHGITFDKDLPDTSKNNRPTQCSVSKPGSSPGLTQHDDFLKKFPRKVLIENYIVTPENDKAAVMSLLVQYGPLTVGVDAKNWFLYNGGVFTKCPTDDTVNTDHAVILQGWGHVTEKDKTLKYWTIKNSWGSWWGENGYIRMVRYDNDEQHCFMDKNPQEGSECAVEFGGRTEVKTCGACGVILSATVPVGAKFAPGVEI